MPVAFISTRTSPAFGPSSSSSMISSGFVASDATAARVFILSSTFALQQFLLSIFVAAGRSAVQNHSLVSHAGIFGLLDRRDLVLMLCRARHPDGIIGARPKINVDVVEVADHILVVAERRHDVILRR